jgi:hypothetical protein
MSRCRIWDTGHPDRVADFGRLVGGEWIADFLDGLAFARGEATGLWGIWLGAGGRCGLSGANADSNDDDAGMLRHCGNWLKGRGPMQPEPVSRSIIGSRSAFLRAWRGEIGLYRAAYGLGGLGLVLVSLLGDALLSVSTFAGGGIGWLSYIAGGTGELALAWISIVATWRAARRGRPGGGAYRPMAVALAFAFVCIQLLLVATWTGWSGLAELGVASEPGDFLLRALTVAVASDCAGVDQLCKALALFVN